MRRPPLIDAIAAPATLMRKVFGLGRCGADGNADQRASEARVVLGQVDEILEAEEAHATEVRARVLSLQRMDIGELQQRREMKGRACGSRQRDRGLRLLEGKRLSAAGWGRGRHFMSVDQRSSDRVILKLVRALGPCGRLRKRAGGRAQLTWKPMRVQSIRSSSAFGKTSRQKW